MNLKRLLPLFALLFLLSNNKLLAQDFMLQGWYWDYPKKDCPHAGTPTWASVLEGQANSIAQGGFTYIWLPPATNASFGKCSNGYDPRDLYDLGNIDSTGLGTRAELNTLTTSLGAVGVKTVADVIYNHRDGGVAESNPAVKDYITLHYDASKSPFPSDRYRCVLPLGGTSGNGAGDYYIKIKSKTGDPKFNNFAYKIYANTNTVGWQGLSNLTEIEPNGGGDCGAGGNATVITLGRNFTANVDYNPGGCIVDEFKLTLTASDFDATGDFLYIVLNNSGAYSDHTIYGIWNASAGADVAGQLDYQTFTNFNAMPSGQGGMTFENFRPTTANAATEKLDGFWNWMWFFYDYDHSVASTRTGLFDWTKWMWNNAGFRGFRMDAVKHFDPSFIGDLLDDLHDNNIDPGMVVGEYYDESAGVLNGWISDVQADMDADTRSAIDIRLFDFELRAKLKNVCDNGDDTRDIFNAGMVAAGANSQNVVTFLNNHDYRDAFQPVWNDQILAYAYLLTNNQIGLPCVYYPEYFGIQPNEHHPNVDLKTEIDELISIHKNYIYGSSNIDHLNRHSTGYHQFFNTGSNSEALIYQMAAPSGGKEIIVAINFGDTALDMWQAINFDVDQDGTNNYGAGQTFTEVTNDYALGDLTVFSPNNDVNIKLPAKSYAVWVQGVILPVELLSFSAKKDNEQVQLNWQTAQEVDLSHFEVERSFDGVDFRKIGHEVASGQEEYQVFDKNLPLSTNLYYRLKMVDIDGKYDYSSIENIRAKSSISSLVLSPNPVKNILNLQIESPSLTGDLQDLNMFNSKGEVVMTKEGINLSNDFPMKIDVSSFSKGSYFIRIGKNGMLSAKFIKS